MQGAMEGTRPLEPLFSSVNFFGYYRHFIALLCTTVNGTEERHLAFTGLVESRIRFLVASLERIPQLEFCHPHPTRYNQLEELVRAVTKHEG
jgi:poly(A) polymerase Pap1